MKGDFLRRSKSSRILSKDMLIKMIVKIDIIRPQLVKSLVIVIYFFETEMRDAVIINYCCIAALQGKAVAKLWK